MAQVLHRFNQLPARWCRGESVHVVVGRPGVHSLSRVIPKDFKKWYSQLSCLALSIKKKDSVENKPASLLVVSLGKALNGTPPPLCGRQVAPPVLHRIIIVKLPTQHVVNATLGYPPVAVRLVGGGATSHSRLVRNGLPSFP